MKDKPIDVIIDTDIGDDIDDAFALCLAMKSPELRLLGVTTVFKDTASRARIAARLLRLGGFGEVPVVAGCAIPLCNYEIYGKPIDFTEKPISYIGDYDTEVYRTDIDAVAFLIQTLEAAESPIKLITLGALTNIADLLRRRPDLTAKIASISMMGGAFISHNLCEYNFTCDPEAASIVIRSGVPIDCVGLDVTFQCKLSKQQVEALNNHAHPCIRMLMDMRMRWAHDVYLHDPLAVVAAFDKNIASFEKIQCKVELNGSYTRGQSVNLSNFTWALPGDDSTLEVAYAVQKDKVVELCMDRLTSY